MSNATASPPRWKFLLDEALKKNPGSTVFQFATLEPPSPSNPHPQPRVRSHVFRSFIDALPPGVRLPPATHTLGGGASPTEGRESDESEELESGVTFPLLISTTDIRTPKVSQLLSNPHIELVWWIDGGGGWDGPGKDSTKQQFRVAGAVSLVPGPAWSPPSGSVGRREAGGGGGEQERSESGRGTQGVGDDESEKWWETQRTQCFASMSAHMKASWARPTPGSPLTLHGGHDAPHSWPTTVEGPSQEDSKEERERKQKLWDEALGNFALVVIAPREVDFVDLGVVPNRRWKFWREGGVWREEEVVA